MKRFIFLIIALSVFVTTSFLMGFYFFSNIEYVYIDYLDESSILGTSINIDKEIPPIKREVIYMEELSKIKKINIKIDHDRGVQLFSMTNSEDPLYGLKNGNLNIEDITLVGRFNMSTKGDTLFIHFLDEYPYPYEGLIINADSNIENDPDIRGRYLYELEVGTHKFINGGKDNGQ